MFEELGVLTCHDINGLSIARPLLLVDKASGTIRREHTSPSAPPNGYRQIRLWEIP